MKTTAFAAALLILGASTPAIADHHGEKTEKKASLTIDSSIEELMANEATAAILQKHLPGIDQHPAYDSFKGWSLVQLQPMSAGQITDETIAAVKADLAALG